MLLALRPNASTASSACPSAGSGTPASSKRTRGRSSRATRKSIGGEGILPAPSAGGKAQTSMVLGRGALPSVIQNSARRNEHVQLPSAGSVRLWAAVLVPALLLAAGCGSSKKSTSSTSATTAPATLALS